MKNCSKKITIILVGLLLITIFLSVKVTKRATQLILDGDASAEMVLSNSLSKSNEILSHDWIYGPELRVVHTQLIYSFLFRFMSDWGKVRFYGTLILQTLFILSFIFMMRQANQSTNAILLGIILLFMPYCVVYGRIALYQTIYLPNITFSFLIVGLIFSVIRNCSNKIKCIIHLVLTFIVSFIFCLNGSRYIAEIFLPLLLTCAVYILIKNQFFIGKKYDKVSILWYISLLGSIIFGLGGFFINQTILHQNYSFGNISNRTLTIRTYFETSIWQCILHQFGFRTDVALLSVIGIFSIFGLITAVYCFYCSLSSMIGNSNGGGITIFILRNIILFGFLCTIIELCVFKNIEITPRYFISSSVWMIPLLVSYLDGFISYKGITPRKVLYYFCILTLLGNGLLNMSFFLNPDGIAKQPYEGLPITNPNLVTDLKRSIEFITENNYEFGYATYWEATTITEKTNGLPVGGFTVEGDKLVPAMMLTLRSYATYPAEKVFLLMDVTNAQYFPNFEVPFEWEEVYRDTKYVIYDIVNYDRMRIYLDSNR